MSTDRAIAAASTHEFSPMEEAIWSVIEGWDISRDGNVCGYAGANGDDVRAIAVAVRECFGAKPDHAVPELPEWAKVDKAGDLTVSCDQRNQYVWREHSPDDLDRIAEACRIRASQLRAGR